MREQKKSRRRKAPPNTEWHGDTLYGRIRLKGKLKRWSLRTGDVDLARQVVAADIERLKAEVYSPDSRVDTRTCSRPGPRGTLPTKLLALRSSGTRFHSSS